MKALIAITVLTLTAGSLLAQAPFQCPPGMLCVPAPGFAAAPNMPRPGIQELIQPGGGGQPQMLPPGAIPLEFAPGGEENISVLFRRDGGLFGRRQVIQIIVQNRQAPPQFIQAPQWQPPVQYAAPPQFAFQQQWQPPQFAPSQQFEPRLQWQPSSVCFGGQCYPLR